MRKTSIVALAVSLALLSGGAVACVFGTVYSLPIPFGMYASGATAALVASFVIVGYVLKVPAVGTDLRAVRAGSGTVSKATVPQWIVRSLAGFSVFGLLLTIATGLFGSTNPLINFNMTFFWIIFALGFTYVTALLGDLYALINPWRAICRAIERTSPEIFRGRLRYPAWLGYYPALALYMAFIWIELFGQIHPRTLSLILLIYTGLNSVAAWLIGKEAWFRYGEFFSVFFRLIGKMAPVEYILTSDPKASYRVQERKPFVGLLEGHADHVSLLLFVIFMLSSTAFDGAHDTLPWVGIFWRGIYPVLSAVIHQQYFFFLTLYYAWQYAMLLLSPLFYLAIYLVLIWLAKVLAHSSIPLRTLALRFAFTLIPIAFVYNLTHYYTDLFSQGVQIVRMISDPFNLGWNLFGTSQWISDPIVLDASGVWHTQVALILFGHVVSVYLAHVEALKVFPGRRHAVLSQLPMLVLMVLLTTIGLWILSLPIDAGQMMTPSTNQVVGLAVSTLPVGLV
jgi:hypothetical protein